MTDEQMSFQSNHFLMTATSYLDFHNWLLFGLPATFLSPLQFIFYTKTRIIFLKCKSNATPLLQTL